MTQSRICSNHGFARFWAASQGRLCLGEACGTPDGGNIACGEAGPDVPLANIRAMYEAFRE